MFFENWRERAACKGMEISIFYPDSEEKWSQKAKETCAGCFVRPECSAWADKNFEVGVWGGKVRAARRYDKTRPVGEQRVRFPESSKP